MFGITNKKKTDDKARVRAPKPTAAAPGDTITRQTLPKPHDPTQRLLVECRDMLAAVLDGQADQRVQIAELIETLRELGAVEVTDDVAEPEKPNEPQG